MFSRSLRLMLSALAALPSFAAPSVSVWPSDTPANRSYLDRIKHGPNYTLEQAVSGNVSLASVTTPAPSRPAIDANAEAFTAFSA